MLRLALWLVCASAAPARAAEDPRPPDRPPRPGAPERATDLLGADSRAGGAGDTRLDAAARAALERGLSWLAARAAESPDGSLPPAGLDVRESRGFASVAIDALTALAWMGDGTLPGRGPRGAVLARTIDRLALRVELDAAAAAPGYVSEAGDTLSRMHGHGFAALALSQAWCSSPLGERGGRLQRVIPLAVRCIERTQGLEGGWWYDPEKSLQHEGSITITLVQALRSARHAGVAVDARTVARAVEYVQRSQKQDGSFRYALADPSSSVALTAAALSTLEAAGRYSGKELEEGYAWLLRALEIRASGGSQAPNPFEPDAQGRGENRLYCEHYERLYLAQALWQHPDAGLWQRWAPRETARVLTRQRDDGAWSDARFGDVYATAMSCLYLEIPLGLLPIFQR